MYQQVPDLEQRLSELQAQIDRLSLSLHLWRQTQDSLQPMERRLAQLTDQCADILERWTVTGERHAQVVGELETRLVEWHATEARMEQDAAQRIQGLERIIQREWSELRRIHEEPLRELREQATSLGEVSVATAQSAHAGFERAEARLAAIETELHRWMAQLAGEVQAAVADRIRNDPQGWPHPSSSATWPLDGVLRLHDQLRQGLPDAGPGASVVPKLEGEVQHSASGTVDGRQPSATNESTSAPAPTDLSTRVDSLERAITDGQIELREAAARSERVIQAWRWPVVVLVIGTVVAALFAWQSQRQARSARERIGEAERQTQLVRDNANQQIAATREVAAKEVADARDIAARTQTIANVLAAPDLVRYNLSGRASAATPMSGQLLWSRSRGLVFSASRLPEAPPNSTYQIWLLTNGDPVSASTFAPDVTGRVTIAMDSPPKVPRPVINVSVTIEPTGGSAAPTGETLLARTP